MPVPFRYQVPAALALTRSAETVTGMFVLVLVGIALAVAVSVGMFPAVTVVADSALSALMTLTSRGVDFALGGVADVSDSAEIVTVLSVVAAVITPGLLALGLVIAARASAGVRRALTAAVAIVAVVAAVTTWNDGGWALALLVFPVAALMWVAEKIAVVAAIFLAALLTLRWWPVATDTDTPAVQDGAASLAAVAGMGDTSLWAGALLIVGAAPFVAAVWRAIRI